MSNHTPERTGRPQLSDTGRTNYEAMIREAQLAPAGPEPLSLDRYTTITQQVQYSRAQLRREGYHTSEALPMLHEALVEDAEDPREAHFAAVLIDMPYMEANQRWLDVHPKGSHRNRDEKHQAQAVVGRMVEYDHLVRQVILEGRESFDRAQLTAFMTQGFGDRHQAFVRNTIRGVTPEIALLEVVSSTPGVEEAGFTGVQVDQMQGADVWARYKGNHLIGLDAKFDQKGVVIEERRGNFDQRVTVGVPEEAIEESGFGLSSWGRRNLMPKIEGLLAGATRG